MFKAFSTHAFPVLEDLNTATPSAEQENGCFINISFYFRAAYSMLNIKILSYRIFILIQFSKTLFNFY